MNNESNLIITEYNRTIQGFLRRQPGQQFALGRAVPVAEQRAETAAGVALQMLDQLL